jgi:gamma-glutamyl:cysteine ligase YbdK (ATP-grasp superfamily)
VTARRPLGLFEGYGVEVEYAIVDRETLDVRPLADLLLREVSGKWATQVQRGPMSWCNEFALHVVEVQTVDPAPSLAGLAPRYQESVRAINALLRPLGARLMPTSMHPWMRPSREGVLWPRRGARIYQTYDGIFNCRRHGWTNIQSLQVNLSFAGDGEFGRLHDAVRLVLPLIPALAASSPVVEGRVTNLLDNRLRFYRDNQRLVPSITGSVIPPVVRTRAAYKETILEPMYCDMAPHDPDGILRREWLNSRGAIARFDRGAIEVRLADLQECPRMDMAVCAAVSGVIRALVEGRWADPGRYGGIGSPALRRLLAAAVKKGDEALVRSPSLLALFGVREKSLPTRDLWRHLANELAGTGDLSNHTILKDLGVILEKGTLARRILAALGDSPSEEHLHEVYRRLCGSLARGRPFDA